MKVILFEKKCKKEKYFYFIFLLQPIKVRMDNPKYYPKHFQLNNPKLYCLLQQ